MADELTNLKSNEPMSGPIMLIFWWAMLICAIHASTRMVGAGDTWVAMACGRHFINHGVDTVEPFSANSHKPGPTEEEVKTWPKWAQWITDKVGLDTVKYWHPTGWLNQNWLTHVLFYWLTHDSPIADAETFDKPIVEQNITYNSLVYWKYALYIITIIVVYYTGKVLGANPALSAIFACFALFVGRTFLDIRPAGFSNMLTAVLLFVFILTVYRNYLYIWLIVPITVLWCNLHGGYVYVFLVLVPFIGIHLLTLLPKKISTCLYYSLGWLFLYALAVKFRSHAYLTNIKPFGDGLFYFILFAAAVSIAMTIWKNTKAFLFYGEHIITTFIIFFAVCGRFYPQGISRFVAQDNLFKAYVKDGRLTFFVVFIGFVFAAVLLGAFRHRLRTITWKSWRHTVAAAAVAFIAMIIFNPFHLTNLTHTFVISVSEHAKLWKTVNEWHPAFEWSNPVGSAVPFLIMYIIAWMLLVFWIFCLTLKPRLVSKKVKVKTEEASDSELYAWPLLDLPLLVIAAMTVYMAVGSRRFIPVAGVAACPVLAMFLDNCIRMLAAIINLKKTGRAALPDFPMTLQKCLAAGVLAIVLFLTGWWGYWYKTIYLAPWPDNGSLTSVFMRMTASYAKPFKACQFLRDNNLSGTVFNYWTEGGFIAYGQIPNPNTGKTPLQLYMDGRAQAAYDTSAYQKWMHIAAGGEPAKLALLAGRNYTLSDYQAIGEWLDKQFEEDNVWFVFMPLAQFDSEVVKGLETHPNWRVIYMDEDQRIYASIKSEQGKNLYLGMFNGQTKYPDEFSRLFTVGRNLLYIQNDQQVAQGCDFLIQAFAIFPSHGIFSELISVAKRLPPLRERIIEVFGQYLDDFVNNKKTYMKQDGYRNRLIAATLISDYFASINRNQPKIAEKYREIVNGFTAEQWRLNQNSRW